MRYSFARFANQPPVGGTFTLCFEVLPPAEAKPFDKEVEDWRYILLDSRIVVARWNIALRGWLEMDVG